MDFLSKYNGEDLKLRLNNFTYFLTDIKKYKSKADRFLFELERDSKLNYLINN